MNELFRQSVIDNSEKIKLYICKCIQDEACPSFEGVPCESCIIQALKILLKGVNDFEEL